MCIYNTVGRGYEFKRERSAWEVLEGENRREDSVIIL